MKINLHQRQLLSLSYFDLFYYVSITISVVFVLAVRGFFLSWLVVVVVVWFIVVGGRVVVGVVGLANMELIFS